MARSRQQAAAPSALALAGVAFLIAAATGVHAASNPSNRYTVTYGDRMRPSRPPPNLTRRPRQRIWLETDKKVVEWVRSIFDAVKPVDTKKREYRFAIVKLPGINAFALANGQVVIFRGLLNFVKSDDELAGVIAHELAHIELGHHRRRSKKAALNAGLMGLAAALAKVPSGGIMAGQILGQAMTMSYGRKQELAADRWGTECARKAGFNPTAMISFLDRLRSKEKEQPGFLATAMMSHPLLTTRLRIIRKVYPDETAYGPTTLTLNVGTRAYAPRVGRPDLLASLGSLRMERSCGLLGNGGFEKEAFKGSMPAGWERIGLGMVRRDPTLAWDGSHSLRLEPIPDALVPAKVLSPAFSLTGRFHYGGVLWMRSKRQGEPSPAVHLVIPGGPGLPPVRMPIPLEGPGPSRKWQRVRFLFPFPGDAVVRSRLEAVRLEIAHAGQGPLWLDGVQVREVGRAITQRPAAINLVSNGGFEAVDTARALPQGWVVLRGEASSDLSRARSGSRCLGMRTGRPGEVTTVRSRSIKLAGASDLLVAGYVQGAGRGLRCWVGLELLDGDRKPVGNIHTAPLPVNTNTGWEGFREIFFWGRRVPPRARYARLLVELSASRSQSQAWVDDLALVAVQKGGGR